MALADFVDAVESTDRTLTVLNRDAYDPVVRLLERTFESEHVEVVEAGADPSAPANLVQLRDGQGVGVATSALESIRDQLLLVNSDLYITGTRSLSEVDTADVVASLDDTTFTVSNRSKLLLIHISRHVEALALRTEGGTLHSGFQNLSRIHDERGTQRAYRRLVAAGVDVHAYGVPDCEGRELDGITAHPREEGEIPAAWFVVHDGAGDDQRKAALVAVEVGENEYDGFWTFRPGVVEDVLAYLETTYLSAPR